MWCRRADSWLRVTWWAAGQGGGRGCHACWWQGAACRRGLSAPALDSRRRPSHNLLLLLPPASGSGCIGREKVAIAGKKPVWRPTSRLAIPLEEVPAGCSTSDPVGPCKSLCLNHLIKSVMKAAKTQGVARELSNALARELLPPLLNKLFHGVNHA